MWKPIWTEGLFLSQHHFQALDQYHETLLRDRLAAVRRFGWGVLHLEINTRALQGGEIHVQRLEAVWPDGLLVRAGSESGEPSPDPRSFVETFAPEAEHLDVFAAVAVEDRVLANVCDPEEPGPARRYARATRHVHDFSAGGAPEEIEIAVPKVHLVFGSEPQRNLSLLRVARLKRGAGGQVMLDERFAPSCLHIGAAPALATGLERLLGAVATRQRELASSRKQRSAASVELHAADARSFWMLHTLNAAVPRLTHLLDTQSAHPEEVYLALAELAGQLCTFSPGADPASVPRFDYLDLGATFEGLFALVHSLLSVDAAPSYTEVPLERRADGMFTGKFPDPRLANCEFFVAVKSSAADAVVRERIPQVLKVAAWKHITEVVKQARRGVRAEVEWNPSAALPLRPGVCFFRLRREGNYWEEIAKSRTIALYAPPDGDWKDAEFQVYAVRSDLVSEESR